MKIAFTKMHGLGNDFMVIDNTQAQNTFDKPLITKLASRQLGVGFDQLLLVEKSNDAKIDFNYRIFNADGTEVGQCGNGARCLAEFIYAKGLSTKNPVVVATTQDHLTLTRHADGLVEAALAYPRFSAPEIPTTLPVVEGKSQLGMYEYDWPCGVVNIGNPHIVFDVQDSPAFKSTDFDAIDVTAFATPLQSNGLFPEAVNVGLMQIIDRNHIRLRVFERGCGETRACGSGACAAVIIGQLYGKLDERVQVELPGGQVTVAWPTRDAPVSLIGTATTVFEGSLDTDYL